MLSSCRSRRNNGRLGNFDKAELDLDLRSIVTALQYKPCLDGSVSVSLKQTNTKLTLFI
jgi:hypothetical protein